MSNKEKLNDMLDSIVGDNQEQAQVVFHDYLKAKMNSVINPGSDSDPVDTENNVDTKGE